MIKLVDSHCHLNYPDFAEDQDEVIERAQEKGIATLLTVNTRLSESEDLQDLADAYTFIYCSVGIHPHEADEHLKSQTAVELYETIVRHTQHPKVVAIGETGLDYYYAHSPRGAQIESFQTHLRICQETRLPCIIHTRQADTDTIACIKKFPKATGVFHCFSGSAELARQALDLGFYLSFSGIITFKNAEELREVVRFVPLDRILVETDAPFLAPMPYRGGRNEPAFTRYTAEKVAEIKGISLEDVAHQTTENFFKLFWRAKKI
jgi:TatD DNase family protein